MATIAESLSKSILSVADFVGFDPTEEYHNLNLRDRIEITEDRDVESLSIFIQDTEVQNIYDKISSNNRELSDELNIINSQLDNAISSVENNNNKINSLSIVVSTLSDSITNSIYNTVYHALSDLLSSMFSSFENDLGYDNINAISTELSTTVETKLRSLNELTTKANFLHDEIINISIDLFKCINVLSANQMEISAYITN